jgi:hypothetical protein
MANAGKLDIIEFLPYKPGAPHPVASAPVKALTCFCLSPRLAEKFKPPAMRVVVDLNSTVIRNLFYCIFFCTLIIGCTVAPPKLFFQDLSKSFPEGTIISSSTQQSVSFDELMNDLSGVQVIYIGEMHTDPIHHEIQVKIIKEIYKARPRVAIGLEMVDHTYQPILDRWSEGELDQQNFLEKVHWYANWRFDFELYQNIFSRFESSLSYSAQDPSRGC